MIKNISKIRRNNVTGVALLLFMLLPCSPISAQPYKVAIIPFTLNPDTDSTNLKDDIYTILSSRLTKKDTIEIVAHDDVVAACDEFKGHHGETQALMVGAKLKADYALYGTVVISGENISILSKCIDISGKKPAISFSQHITKINEVIPQVNLFASELLDKDFTKPGVPEKASDTLQAEVVDSVSAAAPDSLADSLSVTKADSLRDTVITPTPQKPVPVNTVPEKKASVAVPAKDSTFLSKAFWKSRTYPILIIGVATGDVNRDSTIETIVLTSKTVQMYRGSENNVIKLADIYKVRNKYPIGVDVADINNNGTPEIYVTNLDTYQNRVVSFVLEHNGKKFVTIAKNLSWYLRVVFQGDGSPLLIGQKHGKNAPYKGKIFQMKWEDNKLETGKQIIPSRGVNVMGLAYGDILNSGKNIVVAYDKMSNFKVINPSNGKKIWSNRDKYGGSTLYYQLEGSASIDREYLPMRMIIRDLDSDGKQELIVVNNHEVTRNLLGKFKFFSKSHVEIFYWDGIGLSTKETAEPIQSYMRDFTFGDFDNDGKDEFVAAIVQKEGKSIFNKPQSSLVIYELNR